MAPKRSTPLDDPPSASSDDEETEDEQERYHITQKPNEQSSSEEEEEEEEEEESEEETINPVKIPLEKPPIQNPNSKTTESSSEEESDSEEETPTPVKTSVVQPQTLPPKSSSSTVDSDSELKSPTASDFAIKPSKKISDLPTPEKTPISKRPSSESDVKAKKKVKLSNGDVDDEKKSVNKRVWSDDDEILLLQGFIDYQSQKGSSPLSDMEGFYQFTMGSLPGNASKSQLYEKIRRLKKKFRVNSDKVSANGEDAVFIKPHERKLFDVSKKIWGIGGCESVSAAGGSNAKPKVKPLKVKPKIEVKEEDKVVDKKSDKVAEKKSDKVVEMKSAKVEEFETLYPYWLAGLSSEYSSSFRFPTGVVGLIKENFSLIGEVKAKEMDEKWEAVFENEAVLRRRRIALLSSVNDVETT